jgi:hypothetical protein
VDLHPTPFYRSSHDWKIFELFSNMSTKLTTGFFSSDMYSIRNILSNIIPPSTSNHFSHPLGIFLAVFVILGQNKLDQADSSNEFSLVILDVYMLEQLVYFFFIKPHKLK